MKDKKVILFGGSFDPIHKGHLEVAHAVVEKLSADRLFFIPAHRSPHKIQTPAPGAHRLAMIALAIDDCDKLSVSDCELRRRDPSYTLETIYYFRAIFGPAAALHWLIGADQLADFDRWYKVSELLDLCRVTVMHRAGYPVPSFERFDGVFRPDQIAELQQHVVETPLIEASSTDIRGRLAAGDACRDVLPEVVADYIRVHHLYGWTL